MSQVIGVGGEVEVAGADGKSLTFFVQEMSIRGEAGLIARLRKLAKDSLGPGSFWSHALPVVNWLRAQGCNGEAAVQQRVTAELVATGNGVSDDAMGDFRQTPAGVAEELFARTRKTHPETSLKEFQAIINEANAVEVYYAIEEAISPKASAPSDSPNGS